MQGIGEEMCGTDTVFSGNNKYSSLPKNIGKMYKTKKNNIKLFFAKGLVGSE